jgi:hypothetical protein
MGIAQLTASWTHIQKIVSSGAAVGRRSDLWRQLLLIIAFLSSSQLYAETALLQAPRSIGVDQRVVQTYSELLRVALTKAKYRVVEGHKKSADVVFKPSITRIGNGYILALGKEVAGEEPFEESFKIASEDELDVGTKRLVKAVLGGESATKAATVDDVTKEEVEAGTARQKTVRRVMVAFGPSWAYGLGSSAMLYNLELAYVWERDHLAPRLFAEANAAPGGTQMASVHSGIGLDYYLTSGKQAPYIGIDAGVGVVHRAITDETRADGQRNFYSGFSMGADVGYAIMRTTDVSLFIQLSYRPVLGGVAGKAAGVYGSEIGLLF